MFIKYFAPIFIFASRKNIYKTKNEGNWIIVVASFFPSVIRSRALFQTQMDEMFPR